MCCLIIVRPRPYNERPPQPLKNALTKWLQRRCPHLFDERDFLSNPYEPLPYPMPVTNVPILSTQVSSVPPQANKSAPSYTSDVPFYQYK